MNKDKMITVETTINAPIEKVWTCWNEPKHIMEWAFASDDWAAPASENDVRVGGKFKTTMAAKDGSARFDFSGVYTAVDGKQLIEYTIDDGRKVKVTFESIGDTTKVTESFEMEHQNPKDMQKQGWQAILNNFKKHVEQC